MGRSSLTKKVWLLILTCSVVLAVSLYAVLNGYYRRVLLQNAEKQFEYEDQLCYDHIETYTATGKQLFEYGHFAPEFRHGRVGPAESYPSRKNGHPEKNLSCAAEYLQNVQGAAGSRDRLGQW